MARKGEHTHITPVNAHEGVALATSVSLRRQPLLRRRHSCVMNRRPSARTRHAREKLHVSVSQPPSATS